MFSSDPNPLEAVFVQRNAANSYYDQINISGSNLIVYLDENGKINADKISVWASKYSLASGSTVSASWASRSLSSSYAGTSSLLLGSVVSSSYALTSSYSFVSVTASYFSGSKITASSIAVGTILPLSSSIGSATQKFSNIFATNLFGTASYTLAALSNSIVTSSANTNFNLIFITGSNGQQPLFNSTNITVNPFSSSIQASKFSGSIYGAGDSTLNYIDVNTVGVLTIQAGGDQNFGDYGINIGCSETINITGNTVNITGDAGDVNVTGNLNVTGNITSVNGADTLSVTSDGGIYEVGGYIEVTAANPDDGATTHLDVTWTDSTGNNVTTPITFNDNSNTQVQSLYVGDRKSWITFTLVGSAGTNISYALTVSPAGTITYIFAGFIRRVR